MMIHNRPICILGTTIVSDGFAPPPPLGCFLVPLAQFRLILSAVYLGGERLLVANPCFSFHGNPTILTAIISV